MLVPLWIVPATVIATAAVCHARRDQGFLENVLARGCRDMMTTLRTAGALDDALRARRLRAIDELAAQERADVHAEWLRKQQQ